MNLHNFVSMTTDGEGTLRWLVRSLRDAAHLPLQRVLVLRSTGEPDMEALKDELRQDALAGGVPVFESIEDALSVYDLIASWSRRWRSRRDSMDEGAVPPPVGIPSRRSENA